MYNEVNTDSPFPTKLYHNHVAAPLGVGEKEKAPKKEIRSHPQEELSAIVSLEVKREKSTSFWLLFCF